MVDSTKLVFVTAANDSYVIPLAVMIRSLSNTLDANQSAECYILTQGLTKESLRLLNKCVDGSNVELKEMKVDVNLLSGVKVDGHVTIETYFRLLTPIYLDSDSRAIYLDADMLVRRSIVELNHEPLETHHLLAVPHVCRKSAYFESERGVPSYKLLGIPGNTRTFNAGLLVMNLELWRQDGTIFEILKYLKDYRDYVLWWDQDGLNAVLHHNWGELSTKWNVMTSHFKNFENWQDSLLDKNEFYEALNEARIIHYTYTPKPWMDNYDGPFRNEWWSIFTEIKTLI